MDYRQKAREYAQQFGVDPAIFEKQINMESGFQPDVVSHAGAIGIAQFMPDTAKAVGVDPYNPDQALYGAAKHMRQLLDSFDGDYAKALAGYNAGAGAVQKYGGVPPYEETQNYVSNILGGTGADIPQAKPMFNTEAPAYQGGENLQGFMNMAQQMFTPTDRQVTLEKIQGVEQPMLDSIHASFRQGLLKGRLIGGQALEGKGLLPFQQEIIDKRFAPIEETYAKEAAELAAMSNQRKQSDYANRIAELIGSSNNPMDYLMASNAMQGEGHKGISDALMSNLSINPSQQTKILEGLATIGINDRRAGELLAFEKQKHTDNLDIQRQEIAARVYAAGLRGGSSAREAEPLFLKQIQQDLDNADKMAGLYKPSADTKEVNPNYENAKKQVEFLNNVKLSATKLAMSGSPLDEEKNFYKAFASQVASGAMSPEEAMAIGAESIRRVYPDDLEAQTRINILTNKLANAKKASSLIEDKRIVDEYNSKQRR